MAIGRNHLNWLPLGFARKRLGPVKLVPISEDQRKEFDVEHYDDNEENVDCTGALACIKLWLARRFSKC